MQQYRPQRKRPTTVSASQRLQQLVRPGTHCPVPHGPQPLAQPHGPLGPQFPRVPGAGGPPNTPLAQALHPAGITFGSWMTSASLPAPLSAAVAGASVAPWSRAGGGGEGGNLAGSGG